VQNLPEKIGSANYVKETLCNEETKMWDSNLKISSLEDKMSIVVLLVATGKKLCQSGMWLAIDG
jgi:hypothetical protein